MSNRLKLSIFYIARTLGLFALFRLFTRSRLRILCYHGGAIGDEGGYNAKLFFSGFAFEKRMQWLQKKGFAVVPLDKIVESAEGGNACPPLATAITFDDGWFSTASELLPVLSRLNMPSTLYLCTSHFLDGMPIASVTTRYIIWKSGRENVVLEGFGPNIDGQYDLRNVGSREKLAQKIVSWINELGADDKAVGGALEYFAKSMGVTAKDLDLSSRRFQYVTGAELRQLATQGCAIELHGHIHHYPKGDPAALQSDLQQCFDTIQSMGLPKPKHYCYPSGSFDSDAPVALSTMGVVSATTCIPGLISKTDFTQRYFLPRFLDGGDVDMLEFEAEMSGFTEFLRRLCGRAPSIA